MSTGHNPLVADMTIGNSEPVQAFPRDYPVDPASWRIADHTVITASSAPAAAEIGSTGAQVLAWAGSAAVTAIIKGKFMVPGAFSPSRDRLWIMATANAVSTGNRDLRCQIGQARQGQAATAATLKPSRTRVYPLGGFTTGISAESTYTAGTDADGDLTLTVSAGATGISQLVVWEFESKGIRPLDDLTIRIGPGNTLGNAVNLFGVSVRCWEHACLSDRAWRGL